MAGSAAGSREVEEFVIELVQALHRNGMPAYRIEDAMHRVGQRLGVELAVFSVPTGLTVGIGPLADQRVRLMRVRPGSIALARVADLAELIEDFVAGRDDLARAGARLAALELAETPHGSRATVGAFGLASAASAVFFGANTAELLASAFIGVLVGGLARVATRSDRIARLFDVLAAAGSACLAGTLAALPLDITRDLVTLAAIIVLVPGYTLTVALNELASGHLSSGTARFGGALTTLMLLGCGAAIGAVASDGLAPMLATLRCPSCHAVALPAAARWIALLLAPIAFKVLFQARHRDTLWIVLAGVVAYLGAMLGTTLAGAVLGAGIGSLALGLGSNLLARARLRPSTITTVPGLLVLVPGSVGFRGVASFLDNDALSGVDLVFRMLAIATALVCGLLLASVVLPSRRTL